MVIGIVMLNPVFPTCQVRVARFYVSCPAASASTSTASARSQCSQPDLDHEESSKIQMECQKECQKICQKVRLIECQIECQNQYSIHTSRWYVRSYDSYVRIMFHSGDHSKKVNPHV